MQQQVNVLVFFGPTASGKTDVLERLFAGGSDAPDAARSPHLPAAPDAPPDTRQAACLPNGGLIRAEVVSADSMQVYRGMDIGTAKPSPALRSRLPHHLIDICNPDEAFNAGEFVRLADEAVRDIAGRGALPVVSGGTGFYLKNFIEGLSEAPPSDEGVRQQLKAELSARRGAALAAELAACDPVSAARIHLNDTYRIVRALEVWRLTGRPLSSYAPAGQDRADRYRFLIIGLERERDDLYRRIDERCAAMFRGGLPAEVRALSEAGYGADAPGMRAIGYREFFQDGRTPAGLTAAGLAAAEVLIARNSRRYAKRQITYFASLPNAVWLNAADDPAGKLREMLKSVTTSRACGLNV
jgi:tRNA dimethylallyltransferase